MLSKFLILATIKYLIGAHYTQKNLDYDKELYVKFKRYYYYSFYPSKKRSHRTKRVKSVISKKLYIQFCIIILAK